LPNLKTILCSCSGDSSSLKKGDLPPLFVPALHGVH
jgi:hypothetical protein